ncbi:DUF3012 domain-containing protein [Spongiibacter sp. KMU-158]|uniref:DUF3012 domain-containing protein n=1 Tax=Spongiibacter pelagi TaxID=2760804 RepID=A0A927GWL6_9GAMM|nr:DUF3012 domain-containing protein [Spongiibacter pelagi]MBD2858544.1 DUF3012 domain-containing protein [Spongiibacter pelagi]
MKKTILCVLCVMSFGLAACAPEVGSEAWCKKLSEKPKGDWSANEAKEYLNSCAFK